MVAKYSQSEHEANEVAHSIETLGRRALAVKADVSGHDQIEAMRRRVLRQFDGVDALVNNRVHHHLKSWEDL